MRGNRLITGVLLLAATGCGAAITPAEARKVELGMTEDQVRELIGRGGEATEEDIDRVRTGPGFRPAEGLIYRTWGDSKTRFTVAYLNGRVHSTSITTSDPNVKLWEDESPEQIARREAEERRRADDEAREKKEERQRKRQAAAPLRASDKKEDWASGFLADELRSLHRILTSFATRTSNRLPRDLRELETEMSVYSDEVSLVRDGDYLVPWSTPWTQGSRAVIAYERRAAESEGLVIRGDGSIEKWTKERLQQELDMVAK